MSRIQSSVGLITGIPIEETVNKLMTLAAQPRTMLANRTSDLKSQKLAVTSLTSLLVAFQFEAKQLSETSLFESRQATSSDTAALTASITSGKSPPIGNHLFTPIQTASAQQLLSQSFATNETIGEGSFTFGVGGFVDKGISLNELNAGEGISPGKIRITDRSGESAVIDLSFARSVDDVLEAISNNSDINVTAVAVGDSFKLIDNSGGSGNLKVQEVAGGSTAADLGLAGIDVNANSATGTDVFTLHANTAISTLNDGNGVQLRSGNDLSITLADESTLNIDLGSAKTLDDVLDAINAAAPTKLTAEIGSDGNRIELTDLTTGTGDFVVSNVGAGTAADDLGLTVESDSGTITGARLVSGLRDTLVSSLKGGQGLGVLGEIDVTNRNNVTSNVDLSAAETLGQIVSTINSQAVGVTAAINSARNGIVLTDTTGATTSNFKVADGDATDTATLLGIIIDSSATQVNSGHLDRQTISESTLLSTLNGGKGINISDIKITDTNGIVGAADLKKADDNAVTVGDVINRINELSIGVEARINDRGDGIVLIDTLGGPEDLKVTEVGAGTTAKELNLLGAPVDTVIGGQPRQIIDGTATVTATIDEDDKLSDIVSKINALGRGVTASVLNEGTRQRLSLQVNNSGEANELLFDTTDTRLALNEVSGARDALLVYGASDSSGALIGSSTNEFKDVVDGLNVTVVQGTKEPVTVSVASSTSSLVSNAKEFVASYNSLRDTLGKMTSFDEATQTTGILFGTSAALQVDTNISTLITARFFGVGQFQSMSELGFTVNDTGKLSLDESKLVAAFEEDPEAVTKFFTDEDRGVAKKLDDAVERLAGPHSSVLTTRSETLTRAIDANTKRIEQMDNQLERQRETLLNQFALLESMIGRMKDDLAALSSLQIIPPLTSSN
jgi:flagellar hook-associated protein 2